MKQRYYPPKMRKGVYFAGISALEWIIIVTWLAGTIYFLVSIRSFYPRLFVPIAIYFICCVRIDGEENIFHVLKLMFHFLLEQQHYQSKILQDEEVKLIHEKKQQKRRHKNK